MAPPLSPLLQEQLATIEPSVCGRLKYFPCSVTVKDGTSHKRVYVVSQAAYIRVWGVYPEDDRFKKSISVSDVVSLCESPSRLPGVFASRLYSAGESNMGGHVFTIVFSDSSRQAYSTGGAIDFIDYPDGKGAADVVDVLPHVGGDAKPRGGLPFYWCLHADDETLRALPTGLLEPR